MISVNQLEILLRSVPQYFLFGALAFYVFGWMNKKVLYGMIAEIILSVIGLVMMIVLLSGVIPAPDTEGINSEHIKMVIKMLLLFCGLGLLSTISLLIRFVNKKPFAPLLVVTFVFAVVLFFESTRISRIKFELNKPETVVVDTIK